MAQPIVSSLVVALLMTVTSGADVATAESWPRAAGTDAVAAGARGGGRAARGPRRAATGRELADYGRRGGNRGGGTDGCVVGMGLRRR